MAFRFAQRTDAARGKRLMRFAPRFWTTNFPRPTMAAVTTQPGPALQLDAVFYEKGGIAFGIWDSEDSIDHPLFTYETNRDYTNCTLRFRWRSSGVRELDQTSGPTLTIEGRDATGAARTWYVRLWNYASGDPDDAVITLSFGTADEPGVEGGYNLFTDADPVHPADIDRMFFSIVPPAYEEGSSVLLAAPVEGRAVLSEWSVDGPIAAATMAVGSGVVPAHHRRIATGYDDATNQTPERLIFAMRSLGYRKLIDHYVGMSHYSRLVPTAGVLRATTVGGALNTPADIWHRSFAAEARNYGFEVVFSLSYELFGDYADPSWVQRFEDGTPAVTGWPSYLLSPASAPAMAYLQEVGRAFVQTLIDAGLPPRFNIGEPWNWIEYQPPYRIALYDAAMQAAMGSLSVSIPTIRQAMSAAQNAMLDRAGEILASSTLALRDAVKTLAATHGKNAEVSILIYLPTILDPLAPEAKRANVPTGWAAPAFDRLWLEDYDWVQEGLSGQSATGVQQATARLGYPVEEQYYFSGFVNDPADADAFWPRIDAAADAAELRGTAEVFFWALPQVTRDGFVHYLPRTVLPAGRSSALIGLVKLELPTGDVRLCDGGFITFEDELYLSHHPVFGTIGSIDALSEGVGDEAPALQVTFLPAGTARPRDLSQPGFQTARCRFWIREYDVDTGQLVGSAEPPLFDGMLDRTRIKVGPSGRELNCSVVALIERLFELNIGNSLSPTFHKSVWPGELGHDNATGLSVPVAWGAEKAVSSGGGSSAGGSSGGGGGYGGYRSAGQVAYY